MYKMHKAKMWNKLIQNLIQDAFDLFYFSTSATEYAFLEWIMNSIYNNSSDICCCNKEQCFTPTLLSWSSLQITPKSYVSSATETGK